MWLATYMVAELANVHEFPKILRSNLCLKPRSDLEKIASPLNHGEFGVFRGLGLAWPGLARPGHGFSLGRLGTPLEPAWTPLENPLGTPMGSSWTTSWTALAPPLPPLTGTLGDL